MYNAMMDPEFMRMAQEQMSRIPPDQMARIQQQMLSNPNLMKLATESMKNLRPEDVKLAAEQMKQARPEDMVGISEKMANATPEEFASMKAYADGQISYQLNGAQMLKKEGNELHSRGQYDEAANKYSRAKNNLKGMMDSRCKTLLLQCSLNLMSCYLKMRQFESCINEGSEVLAHDSNNVKALYRRGQAYIESGNLEVAVSDLTKAHENSPDDETITEVLRDASDRLMLEGGSQNKSRGLIIEEIVEEENQNSSYGVRTRSSSTTDSINEQAESGESSVTQTAEVEVSQNAYHSDSAADAVSINNLKENSEACRSFQDCMSSTSPDTLAALSGGEISPAMMKTAADMIREMDPQELQKMFNVSSSLNGKLPHVPPAARSTDSQSAAETNIPQMTPEMIKMASDRVSQMSPDELQNMLQSVSSMHKDSKFPSLAAKINGFPEMTPDMVKMASDRVSQMSPDELQNMLRSVSSMHKDSKFPSPAAKINGFPEMTPDMVKMATDRIGKMTQEELQNVVKMASLMDGNGAQFPSSTILSTQNEEKRLQSSAAAESSGTSNPLVGESNFDGLNYSSRMGQSSNFPAPTADLQGSMMNSMKDPMMQQMFTSMMRNMSPEMMTNMSEQFGMKLSKEDAERAQQAMSQLSPEDLDRMMRWAGRAQKGVETMKMVKKFILQPSIIIAIVMLVLAFVFHKLGFIG